MIERIAMALLDDHFVPRKIAYIRDVAHPRLKVFRHHAGISDDHGRGGAGRHQTGVARRGLTQFRDEFSRSEEHTSELQSLTNLVCRLLLEKKKKKTQQVITLKHKSLSNTEYAAV